MDTPNNQSGDTTLEELNPYTDVQVHELIQYAIIPDELLRDTSVSANAVRVYGVLVRRGMTPNTCYPSHKFIAEQVGASHRSIGAWIAELEASGWVRCVRRWRNEAGEIAFSKEKERGWEPTSTAYHIYQTPVTERGGLRYTADTSTPHSVGPLRYTADTSTPHSALKESNIKDNQLNDNSYTPTSQSSAEGREGELGELEAGKGSRVKTDMEIIDPLCALLADRVEAHGRVGRPKVSNRWKLDMDLLLRRGPVEFEVSELSPEKVENVINYIFNHLNSHNGGGFCWADQIRSPGNLRKHWARIASDVKARRSPGGGIRNNISGAEESRRESMELAASRVVVIDDN